MRHTRSDNLIRACDCGRTNCHPCAVQHRPGLSLRSSDGPIAQGEALGMCDTNLTIRPARGGGRWLCRSAAPAGAEMHCFGPVYPGFHPGLLVHGPSRGRSCRCSPGGSNGHAWVWRLFEKAVLSKANRPHREAGGRKVSRNCVNSTIAAVIHLPPARAGRRANAPGKAAASGPI